ncbi:hypothetical protein SAMN05216522_103285 [Rosenbergiella nectarea]|uniref:Winged helix-turn-helix DNA-binding n=1 Tax=Rosenbergiella nectarea TaxID=988801 RepID=A0A1H9GNC4_9GAMM|nr:hypothetical protein [Rosenbergiella nectarea]SEQ51504.1 hypothetical protein SAMN05216522_103285 [Rosenbergiella nectarea]
MDRKAEILKVLSPDQPVTAIEISEKTGIGRREVSKCISDLVESGEVKVYTGRWAFWLGENLAMSNPEFYKHAKTAEKYENSGRYRIAQTAWQAAFDSTSEVHLRTKAVKHIENCESMVKLEGNDSNLLIVLYRELVPDDLIVQLYRL